MVVVLLVYDKRLANRFQDIHDAAGGLNICYSNCIFVRMKQLTANSTRNALRP